MTSSSAMRAIASVVIRSSAGRKRLASGVPRLHVGQHLVMRMPSPRFYSRDDNQAPPTKNPFEIQFHPDDEDAIFKRKSTARSSNALTPREAEIRDDIQLLHAEMAGVFGEELKEYDSNSSSSSSEDLMPKEPQATQRESPVAERSLDPSHPSSAFSLQSGQSTSHITRPADRTPTRTSIPERSSFQVQGTFDKSHILVLQGPCSYVRNMAVGSNKPKHQQLGAIHRAAAELGATVTCCDSNHEGEILDWLLGAEPTSTVVLCWNARLSESPMVVRALELLHSYEVSVIVVSPLGVDHGPLPASVHGVISGLDPNTVEIALQAATALNNA